MLKVLLAIFLFTENYLPEDTTSVQKEVSSFSTLTQKQTLTINSDYTYTLVDERKLFITSPSGLKHATTILGYDQLNEVNSFELEIKDGLTGKSLKRARLKDMGDAPYISSFSVFEDFRYKFYEVTAVKYPIEVTVRSEVSSKTNFFFTGMASYTSFKSEGYPIQLCGKLPNGIGAEIQGNKSVK
ncbi:hypothetical protein [Algoriphagus boritolerans]|uniref:hypothetical protein n=1 Tax=Algoriphagus boritolerans TaxID=308111 RepID=UPI000A83A8CC